MKTKEESGHIYVALYDNGLVKIGQSRSPESRVRTLQYCINSKCLDSFISERHDKHGKSERQMLNMFKESRIEGEWFSCDFEKAVESAKKVVEERIKRNNAPKGYRELGKILGKSYQYLNEIANGRTPSVKFAVEISKVIGCRPDIFIYGTVEERKKAINKYFKA